jgi:hypothetical protein
VARIGSGLRRRRAFAGASRAITGAVIASEISDDAYEKKIAGLLARGFAAEVAAEPAVEAQWKQAAEVLR